MAADSSRSLNRQSPNRQSLNRRSLGPALGSAVVGVALGVVTILGIAQFSQADAVPNDNSVKASDAVMGGPEYGSRE